MAWQTYNNFGNNSVDENKPVWDLRQIYAIDLLGETLKQIEMARKLVEYPDWFKLLKRDLRININQKLSPEEKKELDLLVVTTKNIILKNPNAYLKKTNNPEENEAVEEALARLEMRMKELMEEHSIFGASEAYDEDEI